MSRFGTVHRIYQTTFRHSRIDLTIGHVHDFCAAFSIPNREEGVIESSKVVVLTLYVRGLYHGLHVESRSYTIDPFFIDFRRPFVARFIRFTRSAASHYSLINSFVRGKIDTKMFTLSLYSGPGRCNKFDREKEGYTLRLLKNRKYINIYATIR